MTYVDSSYGSSAATQLQRYQRPSFKKMDVNGDGTVDRAEFVSTKPKNVSEERAGKLFDKLDSKSTGSLSASDMKSAFQKLDDSMKSTLLNAQNTTDSDTDSESVDTEGTRGPRSGPPPGGPPPGGPPPGGPPPGGAAPGALSSSKSSSSTKDKDWWLTETTADDPYTTDDTTDATDSASTLKTLLAQFEKATHSYYGGGKSASGGSTTAYSV
ncbi:MAG: EF-hand domain-containing protein [Rhodospirillaceae bacterium]